MIATAAGVINAAQSYLQHSSSINISNSNTNDQLKQNLDFNKQNLKQNKDHHTIQYSHSLMAAKREATRDMWAQINHKNQTHIIMQTLLFSCGFALLVEGVLPIEITEFILCAYSLSLSLSILCTFIALICSIKVQSRITRFNISLKHQIYTSGKKYLNFDAYYKDYCYKLKIFSRWFNYVGVLFLFISGTILWYSRFIYVYNSQVAAILFVVINSIALVIIIYIIYIVKSVKPYKNSTYERTNSEITGEINGEITDEIANETYNGTHNGSYANEEKMEEGLYNTGDTYTGSDTGSDTGSNIRLGIY